MPCAWPVSPEVKMRAVRSSFARISIVLHFLSRGGVPGGTNARPRERFQEILEGTGGERTPFFSGNPRNTPDRLDSATQLSRSRPPIRPLLFVGRLAKAGNGISCLHLHGNGGEYVVAVGERYGTTSNTRCHYTADTRRPVQTVGALFRRAKAGIGSPDFCLGTPDLPILRSMSGSSPA